MASQLDIWNLALSHLGDKANIADPDESSAQADHCRRFYPIARNTLLELHDWKFATRRVTLALLLEDPTDDWLYAYAPPSDCIKERTVFMSEGDNCAGRGYGFDVETIDDDLSVIYTNVEDAILRYTALITDTTKYSALFVDAFTWLLASYVAGPLIKGSEGIKAGQAAYQAFEGHLARASKSDSNARQVNARFVPSSIQARDCGLPEAPWFRLYAGVAQ